MRLRRIDLVGRTVSTVAGNGTKGRPIDGATPLDTPLAGPDLLSTQLKRPHGCRIAPDGRLVIADSDNDRIVAGPIPD